MDVCSRMAVNDASVTDWILNTLNGDKKAMDKSC